MEYLQRDNESQLSYITRLVKGKTDGLYDLDYTELFKLLFNIEISSTEARKRFYGLKLMVESIEDDQINKVSDQSLMDNLKQERLEVQKEKYKVRADKNEINKWLREKAYAESFLEYMVESIKSLPSVKVPKYQIENTHKDLGVIGGIADSHYGREVLIKGLRGEILNQYNPEVFEKRMWELLTKYVHIIDENNLKEINFFNLGDDIDGILRMSQLQSLRYGIVDSTMCFSEFMANWLNELSNYVYVNYYSVMGNHSEIRPLGSQSGDFPNENMERIISKFIKLRLANNPNIKVNDCLGNFAFTNISGYNVFATHGQKEKNLEQSIKDYTMLYSEKIHILLSGHLHGNNTKTVGINQDRNIECIQFPSVAGIDGYSMDLKKAAQPGSKIILLQGSDKITYDLTL